MKINTTVTMAAGGALTPVASAFIGDTIYVMLPWLMTMFSIILADLISGVRKSKKLNVRVSWTTAARETMGKMVTYFSFVLAAAMIDVAANGNAVIARWVCLIVCALEGGSVLSNILKPYGIIISPKGVMKFILKRTPLAPTDEEAEEIIKEAKKHEDKKWNRKKK